MSIQSRIKRHMAVLMFGSALALLGMGAVYTAASQPSDSDASDALKQGFENPPQSARPRVWWHWMNGNVTKEGIQADIDWMHRIGIAGMDSIDAALATPQVVQKRLVYMAPDWQDAFRFTTQLADKYGMELSINSSPGWSETGGPWVKPDEAMKKMVWSKTIVDGGKAFHGALPQPPDNTGPIQDAPMRGRWANEKSIHFYRDSAVIAYKQPVPDAVITDAQTSSGKVNASELSDGKLVNGATIAPESRSGDAWISVTLDRPTKIQAITIAITTAGAVGSDKKIEVSQEGKNWKEVASISETNDTGAGAGPLPQQTLSFPAVTTRYVRVSLHPATSSPPHYLQNAAPGAETKFFIAQRMPALGPVSYQVHELALHTAGTVNQFERKAGFGIALDNYALATSANIDPNTIVQHGDVLNLTGKMKADGTLDWTPPAGRWVVLRIGYGLEGTTNHPATAEATGLEVDKLNTSFVGKYLNGYLDTYEKITGTGLFGKRGLKAMMVDSTEVGAQNWTDTILADFKRLRGYDPTPWLPVLTGTVVVSPAASDKFLWDFRTTIADLLATAHYEEISRISHQRNLINYGEALENGRPTFGDDMDMRKYADIPMAAMWSWAENRGPDKTYIADIQGAASVAHVYGQNLVAAESMTSALQPWAYAPSGLKPIVDLEFVKGVNRIVVHTSVHQPVDKPPGLSLALFGQYFNRLDTWSGYAAPWVTYLARTSYMLQQGRFAADIAYFYGEEAPITGLFKSKEVDDVPSGYGFDFVNANTLQQQLKADQGELISRSGARYKILYLSGSSQRMTVKTLTRIRALVADGCIVVGKRPIATPTLQDDEAQFGRLADELFGPVGSTQSHSVGKGKVFPGGSLSKALAELHLAPDFDHAKSGAGVELLDLHRKLADGDAYFVVNRTNQPANVTATFRISGKAPELWVAETGETKPVSFRSEGGRTQIPLKLDPSQSVFVVFRKPASGASLVIPEPSTKTLQTLGGPWTIDFQPNRGAPASITAPTLASWSMSQDQGVKYFSGTGIYTKTFDLAPAAVKAGGKLQLDLGKVYELADVTLNGKHVGTVWHAPFVIDISQAAVPGKNVLKIAVTNLWVNRLIGDQQAGVQKKYTFTVIPTYGSDAPLRPSGLVGPVKIEQEAHN